MEYEFYKKKYNLPDAPGVYFFKCNGKIIYIGKATSLRDRVRSYFMSDIIHTRGSRIVDMITQSDEVIFEETDSVLEALIREAYLIKKHQPVSNIKEKDNKSFNFVVVTKERWPRIFVVRERTMKFEDNTYKRVYGPFPSKKQIEEGLKIIRKIFPFRPEKTSHERFYHQLGLAPLSTQSEIGTNRELLAHKEYKKTIQHILMFFDGKKKRLLLQLEKEMSDYARKEEFEKADKVKRQIFALTHIRDVSLIFADVVQKSPTHSTRVEAYDIAHIQGTSTAGVMTVVLDGEVEKAEYRKFKIRGKTKGDDARAIKEVLVRRLKHDEWAKPHIIVIDGGEIQRNAALETINFMEEKGWSDVHVVNVVKNTKHKPERFIGDEKVIAQYSQDIILANSEAHRFAVSYHKELRSKASGIVNNKKKRA